MDRSAEKVARLARGYAMGTERVAEWSERGANIDLNGIDVAEVKAELLVFALAGDHKKISKAMAQATALIEFKGVFPDNCKSQKVGRRQAALNRYARLNELYPEG